MSYYNIESLLTTLFRHILIGQTSGFTTPSARSARTFTQLDMAKITSVKAREILDSRGNPTVEVGLHIFCS
jgi:hypothetical protein